MIQFSFDICKDFIDLFLHLLECDMKYCLIIIYIRFNGEYFIDFDNKTVFRLIRYSFRMHIAYTSIYQIFLELFDEWIVRYDFGICTSMTRIQFQCNTFKASCIKVIFMETKMNNYHVKFNATIIPTNSIRFVWYDLSGIWWIYLKFLLKSIDHVCE